MLHYTSASSHKTGRTRGVIYGTYGAVGTVGTVGTLDSTYGTCMIYDLVFA